MVQRLLVVTGLLLLAARPGTATAEDRALQVVQFEKPARGDQDRGVFPAILKPTVEALARAIDSADVSKLREFESKEVPAEVIVDFWKAERGDGALKLNASYYPARKFGALAAPAYILITKAGGSNFCSIKIEKANKLMIDSCMEEYGG